MFSARPVHLPTEGRMATKTPGRENAVHRGAMTVHGKSKHSALAPVQPHSVQPQRTKDALLKNPTRLVTARPLGDKTPFPNRDAASNKFATPLPGAQKIAKLVLLDANARPGASAFKLLHPGATPDSVARPSSTRKHVRAPRSANKQFETPVTNGNHWDVSELDLVVPPAVEPQAPAAPTDDYDEIEYMPPNTLDTAYTPPFDFALPNYTAVGASLLRLAHSYPPDDVFALSEFDADADADGYTCPMPVFVRAELQSDDPFADEPKPACAASEKPVVGAPTRKPLLRKPANKPPSASRTPLAPAANKPPVPLRKPLPSAQAASNLKRPSARAAPSKPLPAAARKPLARPAPAPVRTSAAAAASRGPPPLANSRRALPSKAPSAAIVPMALVGVESLGEEFLFDV